jgi:hypothetical protein
VRTLIRTILLTLAAACALVPFADAARPNAANDLTALLTNLVGQLPARAAVQLNPEPPLQATPEVPCDAGSKPDPEMQGRISQAAINSGAAKDGYWCNLSRVSHFGVSGGFKVYRYVDPHGHECAYYDTALLFPLNALNLSSTSGGVVVLDMSDPAHPVQTATLTSLAMLSPHESLNLNPARGLLAADLGNPATYPGWVDVYDVQQDCRHPILESSGLFAHFGHESGFSADGKTFFATGTGFPAVTAIDLSDPTHPHDVWVGQLYVHGMSMSDDGNRAYMADPIGHDMLILDTSQIQARVPDPQVKEISRLTWPEATIPQNAIPIRIHGHPYILEIDEYSGNASGGDPNNVGAARLIDIADELHPHVISDLRLAVDQYANRATIANDPGMLSPVQGYAAHYCNVPQENDPGIVACSFIASGLRVFDIRDPYHPKEIAYFNPPPTAKVENGLMASNFAMSKPAFAPERREIWYSDGVSGFYVLRIERRVWPAAAATKPGCPQPSGRLSAASLGPVRLGQTRAGLRAAFARRFSTRGRRDFDYFCVAGAAIRAGYHRGKAVLLLTANPYYALGGVKPGASASAASGRLRLGKPLRIGINTWYLVSSASGTGVLRVQHGVVQEVGLADKRLTRGRQAATRFLKSFAWPG